MDYPRHQIVRWQPDHYKLIDLNNHDKETMKHFANYTKYLTAFASSGDSYTAIGDGKIYAMFGCFPLWYGVS